MKDTGRRRWPRRGWALITGASSGIGLELARVMAADGWSLVVTARNETRLNELASELAEVHGASVEVIPADLSDPRGPSRLVSEVEARRLIVDVLVNNAGLGSYGPLLTSDLATELCSIDVNVRALTELSKWLLPGMVERGRGRILNVASTAAFQPGPGMAVYFATKAYVLHFSEALAHELKGTGVTVTALCPGVTASGFQERAHMENVRMVKGRKLPSSAEVARYGYQAMMRGTTVAIHGLVSRILAFSVRLTPRPLATAISSRIMAEG
ncbi:MAG: SDR family oxidoreductase [Acidobacteria bacterium]|nr:SDR family oxidoreductase [Acidobacteriota bacterium]